MMERLARSPNIQSHDPGERQRTASNPLVSAWVNASAGSGKTKVLTDRMLRLLLPRENGEPATAPEKILALTFTKAGANEMAIRLSDRLARWAVLNDDALSASMEKDLLGRTPSEEEIAAARQLFAKVVDTPGGLKIMTIHSFCQSVLGKFPIEAGLTPDFAVLEDIEASELLKRAMQDVLRSAALDTTSPLGLAIHNIASRMNEEQITALITAINGERHQLQSIIRTHFDADGIYTALCASLEIDPAQNIETVRALFLKSAPVINVPMLCEALSSSKSENDTEKGLIIAAYNDSAALRETHYDAYRKIFLKDTDGEVRKTIITKAALKLVPGLEDQLLAEAERIYSFEQLMKSYVTATLTRDAIIFAEAILAAYQKLKDQRGALDFNDLILRTRDLLKGEFRNTQWYASTAWVLYKLDEGIEHILIDEAQDTNPEQWEIIQLLSDEFFSGLGATEKTRTIFVVGDEKQSIFSFQRAAPDKFRDMFKWFEEKVRLSGQIFSPVPMNTSFRSVQIVLDAVDSVFGQQDIQATLSGEYLDHFAFRTGQAGLVELWPLFESMDDDADSENPEGWDIPVDVRESKSGAQIMANRIGDTIKDWLDRKTILQSYNRPIHPGDILILVKSRNAFVPQLVRALKQRKIAVSGIDRMVLAQQLVVEDLCAAAKFALLPDDDLILATLLKSPLIGYSEDQLYRLSQGRLERTLWDSMRKSGDGALIAYLENLIERAGLDRPYEFFSDVIQSPCPASAVNGLHAIKKRLGEDAVDPLDEFLNLCLVYERGHTPSLQSFLQWHEQGESEIKRQLEEGGGAVRIMTVHGAKGLQAPIVFMPDTVRTAGSSKAERILWPHKTGLDIPIVCGNRAETPPFARDALQEIQLKEDAEYRRLLYVAMTRAEERLYIGGYTGKRKPSEDSNTAYWYQDIRNALKNHPDIQEIPSGIIDKEGRDIPILRLETARTADKPDKAADVEKYAETDKVAVPGFFWKPPALEPHPPRPLVPSRPSEEESVAASPIKTVDNPHRFRRGTVTHKLLQILPDAPINTREMSAQQFVANKAFGLPVDIQAQIVREVMAILNDPAFGHIFGPGSLAEVPVTGLLADGTLISGQIDRILVGVTEILIIDYKTNRPPPTDPSDVPAVYRRQMTAYAQALSSIYPDRRVRCALLWTDGARLMEISAFQA